MGGTPTESGAKGIVEDVKGKAKEVAGELTGSDPPCSARRSIQESFVRGTLCSSVKHSSAVVARFTSKRENGSAGAVRTVLEEKGGRYEEDSRRRHDPRNCRALPHGYDP